jgi:Na+-driven multidrug efflux pump
LTESVGVAAALFPRGWIGLFSSDPQVLEAGSTYLRIVGPFYGFFGLGLALYFSSQGAGRLIWPLTGGFLRLLIAAVGGWLALYLTGSVIGLFIALAAGLAVYGVTILAAVKAGVWFSGSGAGRSS